MKSILISLIEKTINNTEKQIDKTDIEKIPKNVFGVFVTVRRPNYSFDIHGCIGYWSEDYSLLDKNTIIEKMYDVGYSAFYLDSRRKHFKQDARYDPETVFEITFMLRPENGIMMTIDNNGVISNGRQFNNIEYGIIVDNLETRQRATYLPDVFPDKSWQYIKESVTDKAHISDNKNIIFYAYDTLIIKMNLREFNNHNISEIKNGITSFFNKYYTDFVPYEVSKGKIIIDKKEYVRNIATIYDILKLLNVEDSVRQAAQQNLEYYISLYLENPDVLRQASSFLVLALSLSKNKYTKIIQDICNTLYSHVIKKNLEKQFELGEVLIALSIVCPKREILNEQLEYVKEILQNTETNIFQLNWFMKFIEAYDAYSAYFEIMLNKILEIVYVIDHNYETNYLAVSYECLTCALLYCTRNNIKLGELKNKIKKEIERIYQIIITRYNKEYCLFMFTNGTMRIDITCHILNGINYFEQNNKMFLKNKINSYTTRYLNI